MVTPKQDVRLLVRSFVRPFVRSSDGLYETNKNPKMGIHCGGRGISLLKRDHDHETNGVPLVTVSANDMCSNLIYLKKITI